MEKGWRAGTFVHKVAARCLRRERVFEPDRMPQCRQERPAALLAAFEQDPPPALQPFSGGFFQAPLAALGFDGNDLGNTGFRHLLEHPFEVIELDQGGVQSDESGRCGGLALFQNTKAYQIFPRGLDLGK